MMGYGGMMGYGYGGMGYGLGFLWQIAWLILIVALVYFLISSLSGKNKDSDKKENRALKILEERFARGEISFEEYRRMRKELEL